MQLCIETGMCGFASRATIIDCFCSKEDTKHGDMRFPKATVLATHWVVSQPAVHSIPAVRCPVPHSHATLACLTTKADQQWPNFIWTLRESTSTFNSALRMGVFAVNYSSCHLRWRIYWIMDYKWRVPWKSIQFSCVTKTEAGHTWD